jgi:hypothetical protein
MNIPTFSPFWRRPSCAAVLLFGLLLPAQAELYDIGKPFPIVSLPLAGKAGSSTVEEFRGNKLMLHLFASW